LAFAGLVFKSDFLAFAAGPVEPALDFAAGFKAAGLAAFLEAGLAGLAFFAEAVFTEALGFGVLGAALVAPAAFLVFGSAFKEALGEAFFVATVAFANVTSR
jgi:hypothetical protein